MNILATTSLESNKRVKINFGGGDLSSDAGLLLIKEFAAKTGLTSLIEKLFKTNGTTRRQHHKDSENLLQMIFQIIAGYFEDDCADELTNEPVFTEILQKTHLASQPTISRFWNRMDETTLEQMLFDLDSTLLDTYGHQEGEGFNFHYQAHGYHPLLCFDGLTGDLLKAELRDGTQYCSKGSGNFMIPLMQEYRQKHPSLPLYLRGDSGFATPELYEACEDNDCKYAIRLKENNILLELCSDADAALYRATADNAIDYAVTYGEFEYQAGSWSDPRRVVFKIEKPADQIIHMYTFVVTTMEMEPYQIIQFYCGRGNMENFIKEAKSGFDFNAVSSHARLVNANRLQVHALAYNLLNWFRRIVLSAKFKKLRIDTLRLKLLKIAARVVHSAGYTTFKLCSSCPYKQEFFETLGNIQALTFTALLE